MKKFTVLAFFLCIFGLYIAGCGQRIETFGEAPADNAPRTAIGTILLNPKTYLDKEVVVEGTIASECPAGGFIYVRDNSGGTIYVEMHGAPFAPIPQRTGKDVSVKGIVYESNGAKKETKLLGKGLVIK